jgi:hypothetical protein
LLPVTQPVQVQQLRQILELLQSKSKERTWLKNQPYGEMDESKLGTSADLAPTVMSISRF